MSDLREAIERAVGAAGTQACQARIDDALAVFEAYLREQVANERVAWAEAGSASGYEQAIRDVRQRIEALIDYECPPVDPGRSWIRRKAVLEALGGNDE